MLWNSLQQYQLYLRLSVLNESVSQRRITEAEWITRLSKESLIIPDVDGDSVLMAQQNSISLLISGTEFEIFEVGIHVQ